MYKLDLEKAEEPEIKLPISIESWKKLEPGEISITSDMQMTPPLWLKAKRN